PKMVGKTGFEPATPWSQTKCSTKLSYFPNYGAPERSRTPNLLIRSQALYPIELRAHGAEGRNRTGTVVHLPQDFKSCASAISATPAGINGAEDGIRTRDPHLGKVVFYH